MLNIDTVRKYKGSGTSIVNLIVPPKMQIGQLMSHLTTEIGTATNIKDKGNRKSVIDALKSSMQFFKGVNAIPDNGIPTFSRWYV